MAHIDSVYDLLINPGGEYLSSTKASFSKNEWLFPILVYINLSFMCYFFLLFNPTIRYEINEKNIGAFEKSFQESVDKGEISETQKEIVLENIREELNKINYLSVLSQFVFGWIKVFVTYFTFVLVLVFYLRGELGAIPKFSNLLIVTAFPYYILLIRSFIITICSLIFSHFYDGFNISLFINPNASPLFSFLLSKIDPFLIWFYFLVSIGICKVFNIEARIKVITIVFCIWLFGNFCLFVLKDRFVFIASFISN